MNFLKYLPFLGGAWFVSKGKCQLLEFPPEILEMIFGNCKNLLELTVVCPTFNDIISKSPLLMRRLRVVWRAVISSDCLRFKRNTCILLKSDRKYRHLNMTRGTPVDWKQLILFIEKQKPSLEGLKLRNVHMGNAFAPWGYPEILLTLSDSLRTLTTYYFRNDVSNVGSLDLPNLEEWSCSFSNMKVFRDLKTPRLRKFVSAHTSGLFNFLRNQRQLEDLEIKYTWEVEAARYLVFSFNLTQLKISNQSHSYREYSSLLESQRESLKVLSLERLTLLNIDLNRILKLKLEELELIEVSYCFSKTTWLSNQTIVKLCFTASDCSSTSCKMFVHVIEACSNVETLSVKGCEITKSLSTAVASFLPKLKHLHLSKTTFAFSHHAMDQYPSLETLSTNFVERNIWQNFVAVNPQLKIVKTANDDQNILSQLKFA